MHKAMDPFTPSHCPLCRSEYAHFPQVSCDMLISVPAPPGFHLICCRHTELALSTEQVCEQLHFFLQEAFPAEYDQRELDTKGGHLA